MGGTFEPKICIVLLQIVSGYVCTLICTKRRRRQGREENLLRKIALEALRSDSRSVTALEH